MTAARRALIACLVFARCSCELPAELDAGLFACATDGDCAEGWFCLDQRCLPVGADAGPPVDGGADAGGFGAALRFTSAPRSVATGTCSAAVELALYDDAGAVLTAASDVQVSLSATGLSLFSDATCTSTLSGLVLRRDAGFHFTGSLPGMFSVVATSGAAASATQVEEVLATAALRLVSVGPPLAPAVAGTCLPLLFELRDSLDAGALAGPSGLTVDLSASPPGLTCYATAGCSGPAVTSVNIAAAAGSAAVYCTADTGQSYTLQATAMGLSPASETLPLRPVVRTGRCDFSSGQFTQSCQVSPAQVHANRTFLVYQVTSPEHDVDRSSASCVLTGASSVRCTRFQGLGAETITWQTVELKDSRVDRYAVSCNPDGGDLVAIGLDASVAPSSAFLLSSTLQAGTDLNSNDTFTVRFDQPQGLDVQWGGGCNAFGTELQVVQVPGFQVERASGALIGALTASSMGLPAPDGGVFALATWRSSAPSDSSRLCDRMVRVEDVSGSALSLSRGLGNPAPQCIEYDVDEWNAERIDVGSRARVQKVVLAVPAGSASQVAALSAVDLTRTFVIASGQTAGAGQAVGESESPVDGGGVIGEAAARLRLSSPTELQLDRGSSGFGASFTVYVVELAP